jgi:hypothetical protein
MSVNERDRYRLFEAVEQHLGADAAETLMELLPPVGWADVATNRDLDQMAQQQRSELTAAFQDFRAEMHQEFGRLQQRIADQTRTLVLAMVTMQVATIAAVGAFIARFA